MIVDIRPDIDTRLSAWSKATHQPPQVFIENALDKSLEDWEDYTDALRICAKIDACEIKVYSLTEVERQLDKLNIIAN